MLEGTKRQLPLSGGKLIKYNTEILSYIEYYQYLEKYVIKFNKLIKHIASKL